MRVNDVSSGSPVASATRVTDGSFIADMAVTPDGKDVVVASGAPYYHQVYALAGLTPDGRYGTSYYPDAVAIAPDGTVAAGVSFSTPDVHVFAQGAGTPPHTYDVASGSLADAGLAWDPDGSRLFAVSADFDGSSPVPHVLAFAQKAASRLQVAAPLSAVPGRPLNLYGSLTSSAAFAGGQVVHVTRVGNPGRYHRLSAGGTSPPRHAEACAGRGSGTPVRPAQ